MSDILIKRDSRIDAKIDPAAGSINLSPTGSDGWRSNLRHAAIGEDLGTIDETAVIGSEEHRHLALLVVVPHFSPPHICARMRQQPQRLSLHPRPAHTSYSD